jgi:hypothetical protein
MKVCQFKLEMRMEGGGERVMRAISRVLKAKIYTMLKEIEGREIEEISTEAERHLVRKIVKV